MAARFGNAALAAHQILLQLWNFLTLILDFLAIAAQSLVGAALGAGVARQARQVALAVVRYSALFGLVLAGILAAGAGVIPQIFSADSHVHRAIIAPWWIMVAMVVIGGVLFSAGWCAPRCRRCRFPPHDHRSLGARGILARNLAILSPRRRTAGDLDWFGSFYYFAYHRSDVALSIDEMGSS